MVALTLVSSADFLSNRVHNGKLSKDCQSARPGTHGTLAHHRHNQTPSHTLRPPATAVQLHSPRDTFVSNFRHFSAELTDSELTPPLNSPSRTLILVVSPCT